MYSIDESAWGFIQVPKGDDLTARFVRYDLTTRLIMARDSLGYRHLLIEVDGDTQLSIGQQSRGIKVSAKKLTLIGGKSGTYLDLQCTDPTGHYIFNSIGGEVASALGTMNDGSDPSVLVSTILSKWKRFWGIQPQDILSLEEQLGLFGEVYFLCHWLLPKFGHKVVLAWQGPLGGRHDFVLADKSFEVKTSSTSKGHFHQINGLGQLDDPELGFLYLFSFWIRENEESAMSLTSIIDDCRTLLQDDFEVLSAFNLLLGKCGYSDLQRGEYEKRRFEYIEEIIFKVDESFPRVTLESFTESPPDEVEQFRYSVNLNAFLCNSICRSSGEFLAMEI